MDGGMSWDTIARNVHPRYFSDYRIYDFNWLVISKLIPCYIGCVILYTRGVPGIDWDVNNPSQSDFTKVFYSVYNSNPDLSLGKCLRMQDKYIHTYVCG